LSIMVYALFPNNARTTSLQSERVNSVGLSEISITC